MAELLCYTRKPVDEDTYAPKLAYSVHLALKQKGKFEPLNHNSGVLFAKATENEDGSLCAKSLKDPRIFPLAEGGYGVFAFRTEADGEEETAAGNQGLLFQTKDFLHYEELGLISTADERIAGKVFFDGQGKILPDKKTAELSEEIAHVEGAVCGNVIEIPENLAEWLWIKLTTPENCGVELPETITVSNAGELENTGINLLYSDGTKVKRKVDWQLDEVDFSGEGTYHLKGKVRQKHFPFPISLNRADPCIGRWKGKYYFIATNDADGNHTLYIRESDSMEGLLGAEEKLILDSSTYEDIGNLLWAPEFHEINGKLYIFHAATPGEFFSEESHVMELKEGGNPACKEDWKRPKRIVRADGSDICEAGKEITLDMTCFAWEGDYYVVWSQRQFLPKDLGAWLYIAKLNPGEPWKLQSDPVVLSKPDYGWSNNHTFVEEGPFALMQGDKLYVTFSGAAIDATYVVGLLSIEKGKDLLVRENWVKGNYPILTSRHVEGEYGTGHNAYVEDEDGLIWNTYHARPGIDAPRSSGIRRVHFAPDGEPVLDVTEELDLKADYANIETTLVIRRNEK